MAETMMIIREYTSEIEAIVAKSVLEANDIPAVVLRDDAGGMLPVLHLLYPVRLAVRAVDAPRADEILSTSVEPSEDEHREDDANGESPASESSD